MANGNSSDSDKLLGIKVATLMAFAAQIGIPGMIIAAGIYLIGWQWAPPVVNGHVELLRATTESVKQNSEAQRQWAKSLQTIEERLIPSEEFACDVHDEHVKHMEQLDAVEGKVDGISTDVRDIKQAVGGGQ